MIAVVIQDDGVHYKVHALRGEEVIDVTSQYTVTPMSVDIDGVELTGFHVGSRLPTVQEVAGNQV